MPAAARDTTPATSSPGTATSAGFPAMSEDLPGLRSAALEVLLAPDLAGIVDLVSAPRMCYRW